MRGQTTCRSFGGETGQRCRDCGTFHYPPRTICRICRGRHLVPEPLSGRGIVHALPPLPPDAPSMRPWVPVWIQLEEGSLVRAQLPAEEAIVGLPVEIVPRRERMRQPYAPLGHAFRALQAAQPRQPTNPCLRTPVRAVTSHSAHLRF